mmetsp:Transcript_5969/g.8195  ORF Transcript_5969/g.8195 Transcript_5969/m.8195 type:complete len:238 (+) Transcript_5969:924-1637(+)
MIIIVITAPRRRARTSSSSSSSSRTREDRDGDGFLASFCLKPATKWGIAVHFNLTFKPIYLQQALDVYNTLNDKVKGPTFLTQPFTRQYSTPLVSASTRYIPTDEPSDFKPAATGKPFYSHRSNDGVIVAVTICIGLVAVLGGLCFTTCSYIRSKNREHVTRWLPSHRRIRSQEFSNVEDFSEDREGDESGGIRMRPLQGEDSYYDDDNDYDISSGSPMLDLTAVFNDDNENQDSAQ